MNDCIVVIDEMPDSLRQIASAFEQAQITSYQVTNDGKTAHDLLRATPSTSLVIVRFASDHIDGIQICREIRSTPETSTIHILMIVSPDAPEQTTQALNAGADDIIVEPFGRADLLTRCYSRCRRQTRRIEAGHDDTTAITRIGATISDNHPLPGQDVTPSASLVRESDNSARNEDTGAKVNYQIHPAEEAGFRPAASAAIDAGPSDRSDQQTGEQTLIQPYFDSQTQRYVYPAESVEFIDAWNKDPNITRIVLDTVLTCPECSAVPGFRFGCGACGGGSVEQEVLLHHFACACVASEREFRTNRNFVCPKCRIGGLVAGTDFETTPGCYSCADCFATIDQPELIGHCVQCSLRFPADQAVVVQLVAYQLPVRESVQHRPRFTTARGSKAGRSIHRT